MHCSSLIHKSVFVAIFLNYALSSMAVPLASPEEVKPPNGAAELSFKGQLMHMLVHHNQVILSSSVLIGLVVFLSMYIAYSVKANK